MPHFIIILFASHAVRAAAPTFSSLRFVGLVSSLQSVGLVLCGRCSLTASLTCCFAQEWISCFCDDSLACPFVRSSLCDKKTKNNLKTACRLDKPCKHKQELDAVPDILAGFNHRTYSAQSLVARDGMETAWRCSFSGWGLPVKGSMAAGEIATPDRPRRQF